MNGRRLAQAYQLLKNSGALRQLQAEGTADEGRELRLRVARHISTLFAPASISLPLVMLVGLYHNPDPRQGLAFAGITLLFLSLGPLLYVMVGVHTGRLSDLEITRRSERTGPFLFGLFSATLGLLVLQALHGPRNLSTLLMITIVIGIIMLLITLWWKISIHASSLAGAVTLLTAMYGLMMLPLFVLLVLVSWSRVVLRRHTVAQVTMGAALSILLTVLMLKLRGL
jgi:membrane-associated phospholipid phosphatase